MAILFSITLFLSAALSFAIQPMIGKMVLPFLGGAPAVWNTCLMFFQATLLAGYAYAHWSTRWLKTRRHALVHVALMIVPLAVLPITISQWMIGSLPTNSNPIPWLLVFLALTAGLPLLVVSATAPLLQKWFADTSHPDARDPYFLYAASNAGSLLGLISYPVLIEPNLRSAQQSRFWAAGYGLLTGLVLCCALIMWLRPATAAQSGARPDSDAGIPPPIPWRRRLRWMLFVFIPSSLMLGVTTYITTDVTPIPLLWVVPLGLYLLTFILVFARRPLLAPQWTGRLLCFLTTGLLVMMIAEVTQPPWFIVTLHLSMFLAAAMMCHSELAKDRPPAAQLTGFYLCLSVGGVLGGIANALLAPVLFSRVWEYPLMMLIACLVRPMSPATAASLRLNWQTLRWPVGIGLLMALLIVMIQNLSTNAAAVGTVLIFGVPALLAYRLVTRPPQFALSLAAMLAAGSLYTGTHGRVLNIERDFFGVLRVTSDRLGKFHELIHGNTIHGRQSLDPAQTTEPLTYYHRTGPAGQVFAAFDAAPTAPHVAVIGLGAGTLACYARPTEGWTFYEIDPAVERIAEDPKYFTYLKQSRAGSVNIVLGDARLQLRDAVDRHYGLVVLDAFSSDSIPIHLLTQEALRLYLDKLADHGLVAMHISNRRLNLKPVVANLATDAHLACWCRDDLAITPAEAAQGKEASQWVILARARVDLGALPADQRWQELSAHADYSLWTDDFSNIISLLKWR